jgi:hypothetical protein
MLLSIHFPLVWKIIDVLVSLKALAEIFTCITDMLNVDASDR